MLRIVLPKGSLEAATLELFDAADLAVVRSSEVDYRASINDPRIDEVRIGQLEATRVWKRLESEIQSAAGPDQPPELGARIVDADIRQQLD